MTCFLSLYLYFLQIFAVLQYFAHLFCKQTDKQEDRKISSKKNITPLADVKKRAFKYGAPAMLSVH